MVPEWELSKQVAYKKGSYLQQETFHTLYLGPLFSHISKGSSQRAAAVAAAAAAAAAAVLAAAAVPAVAAI